MLIPMDLVFDPVSNISRINSSGEVFTDERWIYKSPYPVEGENNTIIIRFNFRHISIDTKHCHEGSL